MTRAICLVLVCLSLSGCGAFLTPAIIGGALGLGAATLNLDTEILHWWLCNRGEDASCKPPTPPAPSP